MKKGDYHSLLSEALDDADDVVALAVVAVVAASERRPPGARSEGESAGKVTCSQALAARDPPEPFLA